MNPIAGSIASATASFAGKKVSDYPSCGPPSRRPISEPPMMGGLRGASCPAHSRERVDRSFTFGSTARAASPFNGQETGEG